MKILYLAANPQWVKVQGEQEHQEYGKLELWQELRGVSDVLFDNRAAGSVVLEVVPEARRRDVVRYLNHRHPDVLHFSGHGEVEGLVLSDENFNGETVSGEWLKGVLAEKNVDVLLLNCCWSDEILKGLTNEVGVVIGSTQDLDEEYAAEFSKRFYDGLQSGLTVEQAFALGTEGMKDLYNTKVLNQDIWQHQLTSESVVDQRLEPEPVTNATAVNPTPAQQVIEYDRELDRLDVRLKANLRWDVITVAAAILAAGVGVIIGHLFHWEDWTKWQPAAIVGALLTNPAGRVAGYLALVIGSFDLRKSLKPALGVMSLRPQLDIQSELANERIRLIFDRLKKLEEGLTIRPDAKKDKS